MPEAADETEAQVSEKVRDTLREVCESDLPADPEADLFESGHLDSFNAVKYVVALEDRFGAIPPHEMTPENFRSVASMTRFLQALRGA